MKSLFTALIALLALLLISANPVPAQDQPKPAPVPGPTFGAVLFANYGYVIDGSDGPNANKFDVERMYLTMKTGLAEDWKLQMTTDVYRNASTTSYYNGLSMRLKFAFVDFAPIPAISIKGGMIPGPWNGVVESQWKYRGIVTTASDKYSYIATADLGVSATYSLPNKLGEVAAFVMNGDGYSAPESNRFKDFIFRASLQPFQSSEELKSLLIGGVAYVGRTGTATEVRKNRFGALVGYSYAFASVGAEYLVRKDGPTNPDTITTGNVLSVFTEIKAPVAGLDSKLSAIARYDIVEPNKDKGGDMCRFLVLGGVWKVNERVTLSIDHQMVRNEWPTIKRPDGTFSISDKRWFVHTIVTI